MSIWIIYSKVMWKFFHGLPTSLTCDRSSTFGNKSGWRVNARQEINNIQLQKALIEEWNAIPQHLLRTLIWSMPRRCQACIYAEGSLARYWLFKELQIASNHLLIDNISSCQIWFWIFKEHHFSNKFIWVCFDFCQSRANINNSIRKFLMPDSIYVKQK